MTPLSAVWRLLAVLATQIPAFQSLWPAKQWPEPTESMESTFLAARPVCELQYRYCSSLIATSHCFDNMMDAGLSVTPSEDFYCFACNVSCIRYVCVQALASVSSKPGCSLHVLLKYICCMQVYRSRDVSASCQGSALISMVQGASLIKAVLHCMSSVPVSLLSSGAAAHLTLQCMQAYCSVRERTLILTTGQSPMIQGHQYLTFIALQFSCCPSVTLLWQALP